MKYERAAHIEGCTNSWASNRYGKRMAAKIARQYLERLTHEEERDTLPQLYDRDLEAA